VTLSSNLSLKYQNNLHENLRAQQKKVPWKIFLFF
jgi:hypothetical protein